MTPDESRGSAGGRDRFGGPRYATPIDPTNLNDPRTLAMTRIPPGAAVLDVGANQGDVAKYLRHARGCRVWAIEIDGEAAALARRHCEDVVVADVETLDLGTAFAGRKFDAVLFLDVLEHLRRPDRVLQAITPLLAPQAIVIASVPNVTHAAVALQLLRGSFRRTGTGLLDRTHLQFFDRAQLDQLFAAAGYELLDRLTVRRGLGETEIPIDVDACPPELVRQATSHPDAETYQFVFVATARSSQRAGEPSEGLAERLQQRLHELERLYRQLESYANSLREEASRLRPQCERQSTTIGELESTLRDRMTELEARHEELEHLRRALNLREDYIARLRADLQDPAVETAAEARIAALEVEKQRLIDHYSSPRFRFADRVGRAIQARPVIHRAARWFVRRRAAPGGPTDR